MESKYKSLRESRMINDRSLNRVIGSSRVGVSWARTRTFGGRNRGSRGAPYGSYRSGGGGSRRRSR